MTIPAWPVGLPYSPLVGTLQISRTAEAPVSSDMNSGTTRRRRKYSLRIAPMTFQIMLTNSQAATFKTFHETTLGDGAARFTLPIWFAGAFATKTAVFAEPPSYDHIPPDAVKVSLSLLVEAL